MRIGLLSECSRRRLPVIAGAPLILLFALIAAYLLRPAGCSARLATVASGLTNPRGLAIGPDELLYVAEAGTFETGGRVSRFQDGRIHPLLTRLPHSVNAGVEDVSASGVAFRRRDLYVAQGEASGDLAQALVRIPNGAAAPEKIADFAAFEARLNPDGHEEGSNPFAVIYDEAEDAFYVTDSGANALIRVQPDGKMEVVAAWKDNRVPTGLTRGPDGALYVTLFSPFPHDSNGGRVDRIGPDGSAQTVVPDLTTPIGIAFLPDGTMYVLEFSAGLRSHPKVEFIPDSGRLLRIVDQRREVVADKLPFPTAVLATVDGSLYLTLRGAISPPESGEVVRVEPCH